MSEYPIPTELLYRVKCDLYKRLNRFAPNQTCGRFTELLANCYKEYDKIYAVPPNEPYAPVRFIDNSQVSELTFGEVCVWIAERIARLEAQNKALCEALQETRKWLPLREDSVPYRHGRKCANLKDVHAKIDAAIAQAKEPPCSTP